MAAEEETAAAATGGTVYRAFKKVENLDELSADDEVYVLLPEDYTGNVKRVVHAAHGDGDYAKVAARSLELFPARKKEVVSFK